MAGRPPPPLTPRDAVLVQAFLAPRPTARPLFDELAAYMASLGPMHLTATPSRIAFMARTRFAWVPQLFVDGSIFVRFLTLRPLDSPRWRSGLTGSRWSHGTKIRDLDDELKGLLAEAYAWDRDG